MQTRKAAMSDVAAIVDIYNQGIEDRVATFETQRRAAQDIEEWFDGVHPTVVLEQGGVVSPLPPQARIGVVSAMLASQNSRYTYRETGAGGV